MTRKQNGLGLAAVVATACLALLVLLIALAMRSGGQDDNASVGFPLILGGLVVVATLFALAWRAVTKRHHADR